MNGPFFSDVCNLLKREGVTIYSGPKLAQLLTFGPPPAKSLRHEYGALEATIEVVRNADEAIDHVHEFGSSHTDVIVTENGTVLLRKLYLRPGWKFTQSFLISLPQNKLPVTSKRKWTVLASSIMSVHDSLMVSASVWVLKWASQLPESMHEAQSVSRVC